MKSYSALAETTKGPTWLPVSLLKALCEPSQRGAFFDCQQRQTAAFLPTGKGYISFIGIALSAFNGGADDISGHLSVRLCVGARKRSDVVVTNAMVELNVFGGSTEKCADEEKERRNC